MSFNHIPVLFNETVDSLDVRPDGIYVDCTAGGGSHSAAVLEKLTTGRLYCIDRDPNAIAHLHERFADAGDRVRIVHNTFDRIDEILTADAVYGKCAGVMADLGVSSVQLDTAERGFSFHNDAPLDMRMSCEGISAADIVNTYSETELARILFEYGDEKFSRSIAKNIVKAREIKKIESTFELVDIIKSSMPAKAMRDGHPARRTFQALRIETNSEITLLEEAIGKMFGALEPGGTLAIISFHSLEDRVVKNKFREFCQGCICDPRAPICTCGRTPDGKIKHKPITPGDTELAENNRSRSAKLRTIIKLK